MADPEPIDHETPPDDYTFARISAGWGPGWPNCRSGEMARASGGGVTVTCHRRLAPLMGGLLARTVELGYRLRQHVTGAYVCRPIGGTSSPSNHSLGTAVDLNWDTNGFGYDVPHDIPLRVAEEWERYGFSWGGRWSGKKDWMHFEFLASPTEADRQTALFFSSAGLSPDNRRLLAEAQAHLERAAAVLG